MHQLTEEIIASKEWRIRELEALKKIGIIALNEYPLREQQQYYRMCIPYIYAHWEGFVVESFKSLITYLNNEQLNKKSVINELYTFSLQKVLKPLAGKQSFEQSYQFVEKFVKEFDKELYDTLEYYSKNIKFRNKKCRDNTMITKSRKTTRTQWKIRIFPHESHEKSPFVHRNTLV